MLGSCEERSQGRKDRGVRREGKGMWQVGEELKKRRRNSQRKGRF